MIWCITFLHLTFLWWIFTNLCTPVRPFLSQPSALPFLFPNTILFAQFPPQHSYFWSLFPQLLSCQPLNLLSYFSFYLYLRHLQLFKCLLHSLVSIHFQLLPWASSIQLVTWVPSSFDLQDDWLTFSCYLFPFRTVREFFWTI